MTNRPNHKKRFDEFKLTYRYRRKSCIALGNKKWYRAAAIYSRDIPSLSLNASLHSLNIVGDQMTSAHQGHTHTGTCLHSSI